MTTGPCCPGPSEVLEGQGGPLPTHCGDSSVTLEPTAGFNQLSPSQRTSWTTAARALTGNRTDFHNEGRTCLVSPSGHGLGLVTLSGAQALGGRELRERNRPLWPLLAPASR